MSGEAHHKRARNATEDLRQELSSLREQVFRELDKVRSTVARFNRKSIKTKTEVDPPGIALTEVDPPGDA